MRDKPEEEALAHVSLRAEVAEGLDVERETVHVRQAAGGEHCHDAEEGIPLFCLIHGIAQNPKKVTLSNHSHVQYDSVVHQHRYILK